MATITASVTVLKQKHYKTVLWETLTCGDVGSAFELPYWAGSATVQMTGTFNSQTLTMQGSNDGTNWYTLTDPQGNNMAKTAAAMEVVEELPRYVRPSFSGTTGGDVDVTLVVSG